MLLHTRIGRAVLLSLIVAIASIAVPATSWASPGLTNTPVTESGQAATAATGVKIVARHSGKCVNVRFASKTDNAEIIQHHCHGATNEEFRLVP
jgi:hypothetical protein